MTYPTPLHRVEAEINRLHPDLPTNIDPTPTEGGVYFLDIFGLKGHVAVVVYKRGVYMTVDVLPPDDVGYGMFAPQGYFAANEDDYVTNATKFLIQRIQEVQTNDTRDNR